eukprot:4015817-Prorocentrum_lima.AAC.1
MAATSHTGFVVGLLWKPAATDRQSPAQWASGPRLCVPSPHPSGPCASTHPQATAAGQSRSRAGGGGPRGPAM